MSILQTTNAAYESFSATTDKPRDEFIQAGIEIGEKSRFIHSFQECSAHVGGYVQFLKEYSYLPALIDSNKNPVFLYQLIEVIDEFLDYEQIQKELETLSYSQIMGAISFLRKVAQFNSRNIDIDELEDESDTELLNELREALKEEEIVNVFTHV